MQLTSSDKVVACALCGRTLLLGENVEAYRLGARRVSVCALCATEAEQRGWLRDGAKPPPPVEAAAPRAPRRLSRLFGSGRGAREIVEPGEVVAEAPSAADAAADGVAVFNRSAYRRTISGIAKSLGTPRVSVVPLSGSRPDVIVTVAWEISWYQYRVDVVGGQVRLEDRGDDLDDLDARWCAWNTQAAADGRLSLSS